MALEKPVVIKTISMKEAQKIAQEEYDIQVSLQTIHLWVSKKHLGHQPSGNGGHWRVFEQKFRDHISGRKEFVKED